MKLIVNETSARVAIGKTGCTIRCCYSGIHDSVQERTGFCLERCYVSHRSSTPRCRGVGRKQPMEAPANPRTLGPKKHDLSQYLDPVDALTDRQRECLSLRFEYGLRPAQIARRLGIHHTTVYEHIAAGKKILDNARSNPRPGKSPPSRYTTAADEED